jgi:hypothetical protein
MMNRRINRAGLFSGLFLLAMSLTCLAADSAERTARLAELDAACEDARLQKLVPLRAKFVEECVDKGERPDRASCERYYADYGNGSGNQRLFYELPACVTAFEYFKSGD